MDSNIVVEIKREVDIRSISEYLCTESGNMEHEEQKTLLLLASAVIDKLYKTVGEFESSNKLLSQQLEDEQVHNINTNEQITNIYKIVCKEYQPLLPGLTSGNMLNSIISELKSETEGMPKTRRTK